MGSLVALERPRVRMSPLRPCLQAGCSRLVRHGSRCEVHQLATGWASYSPPWRTYYKSPAWRARRAEQLRREPHCRGCGAPASHADHVVPLSQGGSLDGELQSLCGPCHRQKTAEESNRTRPPGKSLSAESRTSSSAARTRSRNGRKVDGGRGASRERRSHRTAGTALRSRLRPRFDQAGGVRDP
jgi:5-methylcytosine-specific restriction enzyme A